MAVVTVNVSDCEGSPLEGKKVEVNLPNTNTWLDGHTDGEGSVDFDVPDYCAVEISIDGNVQADISVERDQDQTVNIEL